MSLFDRTNQSRAAFRNAAPYRPATIGESLQSSWDVVAGTQTSFAFHNLEYEMFERYRSQIEELTGDRLYNPLDADAHFTAEAPGGAELQFEQWFKDVQNLRQKYPNVPDVTHKRLLEDIVAERQRLVEQRGEVASRETSGGNTLAAFLGGAGATLADPLVLGSMAAGAPASAGILRTAITEALIGAGSEVGVQGAVQATRSRLGEGVDFGQAAENILIAGLGGGILAGLLRGGASGLRALVNRSKELPEAARTTRVRAAERALERQVDMEGASPFGPTLAGRVEHARRLDAAMLNLTRPLREILKGDTAVARALPSDIPSTPVIRPQESLHEYVNRVRLENVPLFEALDRSAQRSTEIDSRLVAIDRELEALPPGDPAKAAKLEKLRSRVADLEGQRKSTAVRRKLNRDTRNLQKLEGDPEAKAALQRGALERERTNLQAEAKANATEAKGLQRQVKAAVKQTKRRDVPTAAHVIRAVSQSNMAEGDKLIANFMAEIGATTRRAATEELPLSEPRSTLPRRRTVLDIDPELERTVKDEGLIDAELQRAVSENPDERLTIEDPETGEIHEVTVQELADDLASDQKLYREFERCIQEAS